MGIAKRDVIFLDRLRRGVMQPVRKWHYLCVIGDCAANELDYDLCCAVQNTVWTERYVLNM